MKTVSVSEIIRTAQLGNTLYILASEAAERIKQLELGYDELRKICNRYQERERVLVEALPRVTAYYEGCMQGIKSDNYQDVIDEARAALAAKEG